MSRWHKILFFINLIVLLFTLLGNWSPGVDPASFSGLAFFGLAFPILLFLNLAFLLYWISQKRWYFIAPLLTLFICAGQARNSFSVPVRSNETALSKQTSVMSYNVRNFDLYNWKQNIESRNEMLDIIKEKNPEVICFQEFFTMEKDGFNNIEEIRAMGYQHAKFHWTFTREDQRFGLATFSKYPIVQEESIKFENSKSNVVLKCDIQAGEGTLSIYNAHLQSLHFSGEDYALFEQDNKEPASSAVSVLKKIRRAFIKRSSQSKQLANEIANASHPVILCGDFNDVPVSFAYQTISQHLKDAFLGKRLGIGGTYAGRLPIALRIDYLFVEPEMEVLEFDIIRKGRSDHYPVYVSVAY